EARDGAPGLSLHPHPRGVRIPTGSRAFTPFSQPGYCRVTASCRAAETVQRMRMNMEATMKTRVLLAASLGALALGAAACGSSSNCASGTGWGGGSGSSGSVSCTVNGAGSTFAAPVYQQWGSTLKGQGVTLNFQPVGSGAGVAALAQGTADFAASDPALTPDD